ncbi:GNAT family N-acetyltransferase [Neisseriaceae bacterium TC5R-5]|nr:GNAT family N-acetyltransferase [Neisseriaceae bacterium TC5R-5]
MLLGKEVGLRAIAEDDLPKLLQWRNTPQLRRYFREYRELNAKQQEVWFHHKVNTDLSTLMFAIVDLQDQQLLGACGLCYIDWVNRSADFSIYLGVGDLYIDERLAPDAAKIMIHYAYQELGLHRLWAEIYAFDVTKQHFFETLGFSLEGRHRQTHWAEGRWHDSLFYGLLSSDI